MRLKLISCEVFFREMATTISRSANEIEVQFLPRAMSCPGCARMGQALQHALNQVDESKFQAVLVAYGLSQRGAVGLRARSIPLVFPRAESCGSLLGISHRPTRGWVPGQPVSPRQNGLPSGRNAGAGAPRAGRGRCPIPRRPLSKGGPGWGALLPGDLLADGDLDSGVLAAGCADGAGHEGALGAADYLQFQAEHEAQWFGWDFERNTSNLPLIQRFLDGFWSYPDFLVVPPGYQVVGASREPMLDAAEDQP